MATVLQKAEALFLEIDRNERPTANHLKDYDITISQLMREQRTIFQSRPLDLAQKIHFKKKKLDVKY